MASDAPTAQVSDLDWLMSGLVQRVPHTRSAVLLSCDGLVKSVHGLDPDAADHMAALASGLYSLGRSSRRALRRRRRRPAGRRRARLDAAVRHHRRVRHLPRRDGRAGRPTRPCSATRWRCWSSPYGRT